jgi:hypothetical protein
VEETNPPDPYPPPFFLSQQKRPKTTVFSCPTDRVLNFAAAENLENLHVDISLFSRFHHFLVPPLLIRFHLTPAPFTLFLKIFTKIFHEGQPEKAREIRHVTLPPLFHSLAT